MVKCPICNGCTDSVWVNDKHYWYCEFCKKYFIICQGQKVEVTPK